MFSNSNITVYSCGCYNLLKGYFNKFVPGSVAALRKYWPAYLWYLIQLASLKVARGCLNKRVQFGESCDVPIPLIILTKKSQSISFLVNKRKGGWRERCPFPRDDEETLVSTHPKFTAAFKKLRTPLVTRAAKRPQCSVEGGVMEGRKGARQ